MAVGVATCSDTPIATVRTGSVPGSKIGRIALAPVFSRAAQNVAERLADFPAVQFDSVRIVIRGNPDTTVIVKDTTVFFDPNSPEVTLDINVPVQNDGQRFNAAMDYRGPSGVVFHGAVTVQSHAPDQPAPAQQTITINYVGPGAKVKSIAVSPKTASLLGSQSTNLTVTAQDSTGASITVPPLAWSSSNPSIASVTNTGLVQAQGRRGTATITVSTPTGISDNANISVTLAAASISVVSGGGQTGKVGTTLPAPGVIQVSASDGVGVSGVPVIFAAPAGGSVTPTTATTDGSGRASATLKLGGTPGPQGFSATAAGFSTAINATATVGDPSVIAIVSGGGQSDTIQKALAAPLVVRVTDALSNPVAGATVTWSRTAGTGALGSATSTTAADGTTSNRYTLGALAGAEVVTASVAGAPAVTFNFTAIAGKASNIAAVSGGGQTGKVGQALASPLVVKVTDAGQNPVAGAAVTWVATNATVTPGPNTDATGQTSATVTAGTKTGPATVVASIASGQSVSFTAVIEAGAPTQMSFTTQPSSGTANSVLPPVRVTLRDVGGNIAPVNDPVTLSLGTNAYGASLSGTLTRTASGGVATFDDLRVNKAGSGFTLIATSGAIAPVTSTAFSTNVGSVTQLFVIGPTAITMTAGSPPVPAPLFKAADFAGNGVANVGLHLVGTVTGAPLVLLDTTVATDANGQIDLTPVFVSATTAGSFTLTASISGSPITPVSISLVVNPAAASKLQFTTVPSGGTAGQALTPQPVVTVTDAFGNRITGAANTVALSIATNPSGATLGGTTSVAAVNGVATFSGVSISAGGAGYTLAATSGGLSQALTPAFNVTTATPTQLGIVTQPSNSVESGVAFGNQPLVEIRDVNGARVLGATSAVTASVASGACTLTGTTTVNAANGIATFTNLGLSGSGVCVLAFASASLPTINSTNISVAQAVRQAVITTQPNGSVSGSALSPQPIIELRDAAGLRVTTGSGATAGVTAAIASGTGTLSGTTSVGALNGVATFTDLKITGTGSFTLSFSASGATPVVSTAFTLTAAPATQLAIVTQPSATAESGVVFGTQPSIDIRDANGNKVAGATNAVTAAVATGGCTLLGTTAVNAVNGTATFTDLKLSGSGACALSFSSGSLPVVTSSSVTVTQVVRQAVVTTQPVGAVSGSALSSQPVVELRDAGGLRVTTGSGATAAVSVAIGTGTGTLGGTTTVNAVGGVATFTNLSITGTGSFTLAFSTSGVTPVSSASFSMTAAPATQLALTTQPSSSAESGVVFGTQPVVEIRNANGAKVVGATNPVTAGVSSGSCTLSGTTIVNAVNGVATFTDLKLAGAGACPLSFTSGTLAAATSSGITVTQVARQVVITTQPGGAVSGSALSPQPVAELRDAAGLKVTTGSGATASVVAAIASGAGTLAGTTTINAVAGVATFTNLALSPSGSYTLSFSASGATSATSGAISITNTVATAIRMVTQPSASLESGVPFAQAPSVEIIDALGARVTTSSASIHVQLTPVSGSGSPIGTVDVATVNGVATFSGLSVGGAGVFTLSFSSSGLSGVASNQVTVAQVVRQASMFTEPAGAQSGVAFTTQPVIRLRDAAGLVVAGATNAVTASIASGSGTLSGTTSIAAVNGVATFTDLKIVGSGPHNLSFCAGSICATSVAVTVGQTLSLALTTAPSSSVESGVNLPVQPVLQIRDAGGFLVSSAANTVTASLASGSGTLSGTTSVNAVNGVATFTNLRISGSGAHTLAFTATSVTGTNSGTITVNQVVREVFIATQPAGAASGQAFTTQPVIQLRDAAGLVVAGSTATVTAAVASGSGTLGGTKTVAANGGIVSFTDLSITGLGSHSLSFTTASVTPVVSTTFSVSPTATALGMVGQPSSTAFSGVLPAAQPSVEIRDVSGARITGATNSVTATLNTVSGTGTLSGTTTVAAASGVATFTDLKISGSGVFTLTFASSGLTSVTSSQITVTQDVRSIAISTQPNGTVSGSTLSTQPVIELRDGAGVRVTTGAAATSSVTASIATGTGTLGGTATVNAVAGLATFTNLAITGTGTFTLSFSASAASPVTSSAFTLATAPATQLAITTAPSSSDESGVAFTTQPVIELRDAGGAKVTSASGSVTATLNKLTGSGTLSGTTTVTASNGVATFTDLKVSGSGTFTITFSATGLTSATTGSVTVTQLVRSMAMTTQPGGAVSGSAFTTQPVVELRDAAGLVVAGATNAVTASVASGSGSLTGTTQVNAVNGVATFTDLSITGTGSHTLAFTLASLTSVTSASFTVAAAPATKLAIATAPASSAESGVALTTQPVINILDVTDTKVTAATNVVTASVASGSCTISGTTSVAAVGGTATFTNLTLAGSGLCAIGFAATGLTSATSPNVTVTQVLRQVAITTQPSSTATSGIVFATQPIVSLRDAAGLVLPSTAAVTATVASGSGTLGGTTTVNAVSGVGTFTNLKITGTGSHTLSFCVSAVCATSSAIAVTQAAASKLTITTAPSSSAESGVALAAQPVIELQDGTGTIVTSAANVVTATLNTISGSGTLSGTTSVTASAGVATFTDLKVSGAGTFTITFSASGLTGATSGNVAVTQVLRSLAIATQPAGGVSGIAFTTQPVIQLKDAAGLTISSGAAATSAVSASLGFQDAFLGGTTTVNAVAGVATFTDLSIGSAGTFTLSFSATGVTTVVSNGVVVAAPGIKLNVGASSTTSVAVGQDLSVPLLVDLSTRGTDDLASLTVTITFDPAKFTYKSNSAGNWLDVDGSPGSVTVNATAGPGQIQISGFSTAETISSFTLRTIVFTAAASTGVTPTSISAAVSVSGNAAGSPVTVTTRGLSASITP